MDFTSADIRTIKKLYKKHFNVTLNDRLATLKLALLVRQFEIVYRPIPTAKHKVLNNENGDEDNEQGRPASDSKVFR